MRYFDLIFYLLLAVQVITFIPFYLYIRSGRYFLAAFSMIQMSLIELLNQIYIDDPKKIIEVAGRKILIFYTWHSLWWFLLFVLCIFLSNIFRSRKRER